jgi:polysaccharide biosynthesis/export protein
MEGRTRFGVLALAGLVALEALVVAVAQEERPRVAIGNAGRAAITKPGIADGASSPALTGERRPLYRLRTGDSLDVSFSYTPEFNQTISVQPDGYVMLRELGPVLAGGLTVPDLQEVIREHYDSILNRPDITLVLKNFEKPYFIASGEVAHPGKYELGSDISVTEALAIAGGLTPRARHSQVVLFRRDPDDRVSSRVLDVKEILKSRDLGEDLHLQPGDLLFVPQSTLSKVREYLPGSNLGLYWNPANY